MVRPLIVCSLASILLSLGCSSDINPDGGGGQGGGGGDCGPAPAPDEGPCPAPWECVGGEWVQGDVSCEDPVCPAEPPVEGPPCDRPGYACVYGTSEEICGEASSTVHALCEEGAWQVSCGTEPPCPTEMPEAGSSCGPLARSCSYDVACDTFYVPAVAVCDPEADATWSVAQPSCTACVELLDPESCATEPSCLWVEPGCDETLEPVEARCRPSWQCTGSQSCPAEDLTCVQFSSDPCWDSMCGACHEPFSICLGPEQL